MVRALDLDVDRPLRVEVLLDELAGRELEQREVALAGERLDPFDELFRVALGGQDLEELGELELEPLDLFPELGELALGRSTLGDLLLEALQLDLLRRDLFLLGLEDEPVHGAREQGRDEDPDPQGVVPGALFDADAK